MGFGKYCSSPAEALLNRVVGITLLGNGEPDFGSKIVTGVVVSACEKSPPRSAAVGTDPTMLLPLRLIVVPKLMVYWARCQFTIFGMCSGPPMFAFKLLLAEYGFCAVCPFSE